MNLRCIHTVASRVAAVALTCSVLAACGDKGDEPAEPQGPQTPAEVAPDFDKEIKPFDPTIRATDTYTPSTDNDVYWQANTFTDTVKVVYNGATAKVTASASTIKTHVDGAYVAIELTGINKAVIVASGKSDDGALKVYSGVKYMLALEGLTLTSQRGAAFNSQAKKRMFVRLGKGTVNTLTDATVYRADHFYATGMTYDIEDSKGCFFTEDHVTFSGAGLLTVNGRVSHGIASDGMVRVLPGTTLRVETSIRNAIHAKGSTKEQRGIIIDGGYVSTYCTGRAAKCLKSDLAIVISGGTLDINNASPAMFDTETGDTSSGSGIKSDTDITIAGGNITVKTTGDGAKGLAADRNVSITGGTVTVTATGQRFTHNAAVTSSPSGIKADNSVTISGGVVKVGMFGEDNNCDAIDSGAAINVSGGTVYCYSFGNGLFAGDRLGISGGYIYSLSQREEAIVAPNAIAITGGTTLSWSPKSVSANVSGVLTATGGVVIATGGKAMTTLSTSAKSSAVVIPGVTIAAGSPFAVASTDGTPLMAMTYLSEVKDMPLLLASPSFTPGSNWQLLIGGTVDPASSVAPWCGYLPSTLLLKPTSTHPFTI